MLGTMRRLGRIHGHPAYGIDRRGRMLRLPGRFNQVIHDGLPGRGANATRNVNLPYIPYGGIVSRS
jgi:hypothetical protein